MCPTIPPLDSLGLILSGVLLAVTFIWLYRSFSDIDKK